MDMTSGWFWLVAVAGSAAVSLSFTWFVRWTRNGFAVPEEKLARLRTGMTMPEVQELLGKPARVGWSQKKLPQWTYGRAIKDYVLLVEFDEDLRVRHSLHWSRSEPLPTLH